MKIYNYIHIIIYIKYHIIKLTNNKKITVYSKLNFEIKERYFIYVNIKVYNKNNLIAFCSFNLFVFI